MFGPTGEWRFQEQPRLPGHSERPEKEKAQSGFLDAVGVICSAEEEEENSKLDGNEIEWGTGRESTGKVCNTVIARYFIFTSECIKKRLAAGLHLVPLGEMKRPRPLSLIGCVGVVRLLHNMPGSRTLS